MMSKWFRFYADAIRNPKVAALSDKDFRLWVSILSVASENDGKIPPAETLKRVLGVRLDHLYEGIKRLARCGLIDALASGYEPHNWGKFQYKSDTSTARVTLHRRGKETPPEQKQIQNAASQQPASDPPKHVYDRLIAAASKNGQCHQNLAMNITPMTDLIAKGYSLEDDLVPSIESKASPKIQSWKYFVPVVEQRAADRAAIKAAPAAAAVDWAGRLAVYAEGTWVHGWGPKPGEPGCRVPAELLNRAAA